jgi:hypothetical protein
MKTLERRLFEKALWSEGVLSVATFLKPSSQIVEEFGGTSFAFSISEINPFGGRYAILH